MNNWLGFFKLDKFITWRNWKSGKNQLLRILEKSGKIWKNLEEIAKGTPQRQFSDLEFSLQEEEDIPN